MAQLYTDEDFSYPAVEQLRQLGHDVVTAKEVGQADRGTTDEDVLAFAIGQNRGLVTFNRRHFIRLHRQVRSHCGIIVCSRDPDVSALAARIHSAITRRDTLVGQLIRVSRPSHR